MEGRTRMFEDELSTEIDIDGVKLEIVAQRIEKDEWSLTIVNELGVMSCWTDYFSTAQKAIEAGLRAIESEGIEPFIDIEGFEYLLDK